MIPAAAGEFRRNRSPGFRARTDSIGSITDATSARTIISTEPTAWRTDVSSSWLRGPRVSSREPNWSATGAIADHGISSAIVAEIPPRRASTIIDSVGSDTETICAVSMCWSTVSRLSVRPATSVQISVSWASRRSKKWRPSAWSMSVMRRSLTPPSIDPPSSSSIAPSSSVLSVESSIRVPIGSTTKIADVEDAGTAWCALVHVSCEDVSSSNSSGTRSSALRRVEAVRQNASSVRPRRRSCSAVNFVGRVKSTARMRRRRCGAGFSSGSRPSRAASTSAAIASSDSTGPPALMRPSSRRPGRAPSRCRRPRAR